MGEMRLARIGEGRITSFDTFNREKGRNGLSWRALASIEKRSDSKLKRRVPH